MIKKITISLSIVIVGLITYSYLLNNVHSNASAAPTSKTGSPGDGGITCTGCHTPLTVVPKTGWITSNIPGTGYVIGTTYTITAIGTSPGVGKFGFEVVAEDNTANIRGVLTVTNATETQTVGLGNYITHTSSGVTASNDSIEWSFDWTPNSSSGDITFYGAFLAAYGNYGGTNLDTTFTSTLTVQEATVSISENRNKAIQLQLFPNPVKERLEISFNIEQPTDVTISIYDMKGSRVIDLYEQQTVTGNFYKTFNVGRLETGMYFVKVMLNEQLYFQKIIK